MKFSEYLSNYENQFYLLDKPLIICVVLLCFIGTIFVHSATHNSDADSTSIFYQIQTKQIYYLLLGALLSIFASVIPYKKIAEHSHILFWIINAALLYTLLLGKVVHNSKRWIYLFKDITIQPSEFCKLSLIFMIANFLSKEASPFQNFSSLVKFFAKISIPIALVLAQPDLGTALVFIAILFSMLFLGGLPYTYLLGIILVGSTMMAIPIIQAYVSLEKSIDLLWLEIFSNRIYAMWFALFTALLGVLFACMNNWVRSHLIFLAHQYLFIFSGGLVVALFFDKFLLKDYQKKRLFSFIAPDIDRWDSGYNVIQSKITIGSGRFWGKGFLQGTQGQLGFLPARSTDFIFSVIAEEAGFIGAACVIGLFFLFIYRLFVIAARSKDSLGELIVIGITVMFLFQIFVNIGMNLGIAPVTGLPLPFLTYGGSTLWTSLLSLGLVMNIDIHRYTNK